MLVVEGIDGCGKSTIAKLLSDTLNMKIFHFPTAAAKKAHLHLKGVENYTPEQLFLIFLTDISLNIDNLNNKIIDRYVYSTHAYQHCMDLAEYEQFLCSLKFPKPKLIVYLSIDVDTAINRIYSMRTKVTKSVFENKEYLIRVKQEYDRMYKRNFYGTWIKLDAGKQSPDVITKRIVSEWEKLNDRR